MKDQIERFYDIVAEEVSKEWYPKDLLLPTIHEFLSFFTDRPRLLDLVCGPGHENMRLRAEGADVVGIDFSNESIKIAKAKNPKCVFYTANYFNINESLGKFDGIFSSGSIIHLNHRQLEELVGILSPLVRNSGYFEIIFQHGKGKKIMIFERKKEKFNLTVYLYDLLALKDIFAKRGFKFLKEGCLDKKLIDMHWKCYIFQKTS